MRQANRIFATQDKDDVLKKVDLVTIQADDILASTLFETEK